MVTKLYIVRHCQSEGNIQKRFQGRYDSAVNEVGEKQLELLGLRFRNEHIDAVYSSPLTRALKTAEAVNKYHDLPINLEDGIIELDVGDMENLPLDDIGVKYPEVAKNWDIAPDLCEFPNGETMKQAYVRAKNTIEKIIAENEGKTVFVATHGGIIRCINAFVTTGKPEGLRDSAIFSNTGVSILEAEDGKLRWTLINDVSHLPPELQRAPTQYKFNNEAV